MTEQLFIILIFVGLAWWHREPFQYAIAGFVFLMFGLNYMDALPDAAFIYVLGVFLVIQGIYAFIKAAWDKGGKVR